MSHRPPSLSFLKRKKNTVAGSAVRRGLHSLAVYLTDITTFENYPLTETQNYLKNATTNTVSAANCCT